MNLSRFGCCVLVFVCCFVRAQNADKVDYLPQTPVVSKKVDRLNVETIDRSHLLAALSLQGIVNRDTARIYTHVRQDQWVFDFYKTKNYIVEDQLYSDVWELLKRYKSFVRGAVVYDPEKDYTVNLATNLSGVENRIILSPSMIDTFKRMTGIRDIQDLRSLNFTDATAAFQWYKQHVFPRQNHSVLSVAKGLSFMYDVYRDYLVEFKIPVFWLPGKKDSDYNPAYENEILQFFRETPVNIPVLGFWQGKDDHGKDIGYEEFDGVKLAGKYGKFTLVNTWVGNYSFHSGVKPERQSYRQNPPRDKSFRKYDPNKKYVALIMNESGDAPCYFLYTGFFPRQWNDPQRGEVAVSYGISPCLRMLTPALLDYMYQTQTPNDFFYTSISGAGYCYPFEGYGEHVPDRDGLLKEYFSTQTAGNMKILDFDMMGLYTHTGAKWSTSDYRIASDYITAMPGLTSIISGMHRTKFTGSEANELLENKVSAHHTLTFWSYDNLTWNDRSLDSVAVNHLEKEIKTYGQGTQFIQAMFYSWHYGPRRLVLLKQRLEKEGYEFVTLNEFDSLWRESIQK